MAKRLALGLPVVAALGLVSARAAANPVDTFGFGSRSSAMAGANAADVDDFSANYYNPAGLVAADGLRIDIGYVRASHYLKTNGHDNQVDPLKALVFGIVAPGKVAGLPFAFGIAAHLPDDRVFRVRSLEQDQPRWEMYDNRTQRLFIAANLAIRPFPFLEIGGGMAFLAQTRARLDITGEMNLDDPNTSLLRHEVDADLTSIRYPQVGVRVKASDKLRFAAVYRGSFKLTIDIDARVLVDAQLVGNHVPLLALISTSTLANFLPKQVVLGGSYDLTKNVTIDADVTWVNWSAYESPVTHVSSKLDIKVPPGLPDRFLPDPQAPTNVLPVNFHDTFVPRIGAEGRLPLGGGHELAVRGGYFYERSPIPAQTGLTNFVDGDHHSFTAGLGIKLADVAAELPGDLRFDVHGMLSVIPERLTLKSSGSDRIGDYRSNGQVWLVGTTLGLVFK